MARRSHLIFMREKKAIEYLPNGEKRSLQRCISRDRFQWHLSSGYSKNLNVIISKKRLPLLSVI